MTPDQYRKRLLPFVRLLFDTLSPAQQRLIAAKHKDAPEDVREVHNPENVSADQLPDGYRFLYIDELNNTDSMPFAKIWVESDDRWGDPIPARERYLDRFTYAIPINLPDKESPASSDAATPTTSKDNMPAPVPPRSVRKSAIQILDEGA